jgi:hypothetical protein
MGLIVATRAFFKILLDRELSQSIEKILQSPSGLKIETEKAQPMKSIPARAEKETAGKPVESKPLRSDAISLLAALQREARLVDIVKEPLDSYSDAQIGSAAREVLKNAALVFERMFGLAPVAEVSEGTSLSTPETFDPAKFRLIGNVSGSPPFQGTVTHPGWKATRCEIPQWTGQKESALIVAPIELEVVNG